MMGPTDRTLRRWLRTGKPRRIERLVDDPDVSARLDAMTQLAQAHVDALTAVTNPPDGFSMRVEGALARQADGEAVELFVDLMGLGWHTAAAVFDTPDTIKGTAGPDGPDQ